MGKCHGDRKKGRTGAIPLGKPVKAKGKGRAKKGRIGARRDAPGLDYISSAQRRQLQREAKSSQ